MYIERERVCIYIYTYLCVCVRWTIVNHHLLKWPFKRVYHVFRHTMTHPLWCGNRIPHRSGGFGLSVFYDPTIAFKPLMFNGWKLNFQWKSRRKLELEDNSFDTHQIYLANMAQHGSGPCPIEFVDFISLLMDLLGDIWHHLRSSDAIPIFLPIRKAWKKKQVWLVVGQPLWKILVSWDDYSRQCMGKQKMATKPPTRSFHGLNALNALNGHLRAVAPRRLGTVITPSGAARRSLLQRAARSFWHRMRAGCWRWWRNHFDSRDTRPGQRWNRMAKITNFLMGKSTDNFLAMFNR